MTRWWDRGLFVLLLLWTVRAVLINVQLAEFLPRPFAAWIPELVLGLAGLGALAWRGGRRRAWLSLGLGFAALRGAYLSGTLADESGGGGLIWPDLAVGLLALVSLTVWTLQRRPKPASSARPGGGARSEQEASP